MILLLPIPMELLLIKRAKIYIATWSHGLMQLDITSKELTLLKGYADSAKAFPLDGLVSWNNTIIGVYNAAKTTVIIQSYNIF